MEKIEHSAVKIGSQVFVGKRHCDCFAAARKKLGWGTTDGEQQGFVTNTERFVDREEAAIIALKAGQIKSETNELYSEDLW